MDDLISRKAVIDILENMIFEVGKDLSKSYLLQDATYSWGCKEKASYHPFIRPGREKKTLFPVFLW